VESARAHLPPAFRSEVVPGTRKTEVLVSQPRPTPGGVAAPRCCPTILLLLAALAGCQDRPEPTAVPDPTFPLQASVIDPVVVTTLANDGPGSLRDAVIAFGGGSTVTFADHLAGGTIVVSSPITLQQSVTIEGPTTAGITISGGGATQVFSAVSGDVILKNLTITGADAGSPFSGHGTAIFGGGAALRVIQSTIAGNLGDGIFLASGTLSLENSTVSGNGGAGVAASGGGPHALRHATIADNAKGLNQNAPVTLANTILANNDADCEIAPGAPAMTLSGANLDTDDTCTLVPGFDLPNTDPLLGPLAGNGGPTATHALMFGSPAVDISACGFSQDQRGISRPQGDHCDIGAFERIPVDVSLAIHPIALVDPNTGAATITGNLTCSSALEVQLSLELTQVQKVRRVPVPRTSSASGLVPCGSSAAWSLVVPPPTGSAFVNGEATAVADAVNSDNAGSATQTVRLFWARK
jgi:hypothetical protein